MAPRHSASSFLETSLDTTPINVAMLSLLSQPALGLLRPVVPGSSAVMAQPRMGGAVRAMADEVGDGGDWNMDSASPTAHSVALTKLILSFVCTRVVHT